MVRWIAAGIPENMVVIVGVVHPVNILWFLLKLKGDLVGKMFLLWKGQNS